MISGHSTPRRNHQTLNAILQLHQRCRFATLKNGFLDPRCSAALCTASLGMTMRIVLRTASLGMTMMGPPLRG